MAEGGQEPLEDLETWEQRMTRPIEQRETIIRYLSADIRGKGLCAVRNMATVAPVLDVRQEPGTQEPPNDDVVEALRKALERFIIPAVQINCKTRGNCTTCKSVSKRSMFTSYKTGQDYLLQNGFSCHTQNTVYLISCENAKCMKVRKRRKAEGQAQGNAAEFEFRYQYVGETKQKIMDRMKSHRSDKDGPIRKHYKAANHDVSDMKWTVIEVIPWEEDKKTKDKKTKDKKTKEKEKKEKETKEKENTLYRREREQHWIHELDADLNTQHTQQSS